MRDRPDGRSAGDQRAEIRVLLVDDDPEVLELTAEFLTREDDRFEVVTEVEAERALERIASDGIDCVVSDYDMPGLDGLALLEAVRSRYGDLPFLLYTAKGSEEVASQAIMAGVDDYLQKGSGNERYTLLANRIETSVARYRAEDRARESRANVQRILAHTPDVVCVVRDGAFEYVNEATVEVLDRGRAELLGRDVLETVHPDDRPAVAAVLERAADARSATADRVRWRVADRDGSAQYLEGNVTPFTWNGVPARLIIARDVTGQVEHERRHTRQYNQLLERLDTVIWLTDASFEEVLYVNQAYEAVYGKSVESLLEDGMSYLEQVHPDDRDFASRADVSVIERLDAEDSETPGTQEHEFRLLVDGEVKWIHETAFPIRDEDGELYRWAGIEHDVTERKERELELRETQQRYEQILEQLGSVVYLWDEAFEELLYLNPAYEDLFDRPLERLWEDPFDYLEAIHPDDRENELEILDRFARIAAGEETLEAEHYTSEYRVIGGDGEVRWVRERIFPVRDTDGEIIRWAGLIDEVTDEKRREAELDRLHARWEKVARIITHDLRNPLGVATGRLDLFFETGETSHLEQVAAALERLEQRLDDSDALVTEQAERAPRTNVPLGAMARRVWERLTDPSGSLEIDVDLEVPADADQLESLLRNLFLNAVTHGGEDVTVRVTESPGGFAVEDDGRGIPPADRDQVLEAGFTTTDEGNGHGLFIVSQVAEDHGWTVSVEESAEGGARVAFGNIFDGPVERERHRPGSRGQAS